LPEPGVQPWFFVDYDSQVEADSQQTDISREEGGSEEDSPTEDQKKDSNVHGISDPTI